MRIPPGLLVGASLGLLLLAIRWLRHLSGRAVYKGGSEMMQRAVQGIALFHVDSEHEAGVTPDHYRDPRFREALKYDHHALIVKLRFLRQISLPNVTIGQVRPIYRVYPRPSELEKEAPGGHKRCQYHYLIEVSADSDQGLYDAFAAMEKIGCHVDGFGG